MTGLRLLADDLTGALDTAAEFVGIAGPVAAFWHGAIPASLPSSATLDSGTREMDQGDATAAVAALAPALGGAAIAFKKIDSLMRGATLAEIAACMRAGGWRHAVLAPAFPYQGRVTRGGVQHARDAHGRWSAVGGDIAAGLRRLGIAARRALAHEPLAPGISVFDAQDDADLGAVVANHRTQDGLLWIGAGGLAQALARHAPAPAGPVLPGPILGLFGSDQETTARQLAACGADWLRLNDGGAADVTALAGRLRAHGRAVASLALPAGTARDDAAR
ncbi:MAG: Hrp-dependent type III effector protein, partial [Proteobacteria bacterium]|nr:Hrp-dependent type III effector protein [Pseudomonadota bacterium]